MKKLVVIFTLFLLLVPMVNAAERCRIDVVTFTLPTTLDWLQVALDEDALEMDILLDGLHPTGVLDNNVNSTILTQAIEVHKGVLLPISHIETEIGQHVQVEMTTDIQYIEKTMDGQLVSHNIPKENGAGLWLDLTVGLDNEQYSVNYSMLVRVISSRKEISGLSLDVGEPNFSVLNSSEIVPAQESTWSLIDAMTISGESDDADILCVIAKVSAIAQ